MNVPTIRIKDRHYPRIIFSVPLAIAIAVLLNWGYGYWNPPNPIVGDPPHPTNVQATPANSSQPDAIQILSGDTVSFKGKMYRLVGFEMPEQNGKCDAETKLAEKATAR